MSTPDIPTIDIPYVPGQTAGFFIRLVPTAPVSEVLLPGAEGIDVSHWQKEIDWLAVKGHGIRFAFIKITEGRDIVDAFFDKNWAGAKAAGLVRAAYHFFRPEVRADGQAAHFLNTLGSEVGELGPILDVEYYPTMGVIDKAKSTAAILEWLLQVEKITNRRPIIYTSAGMWDRMTTKPAWASNYPLWVANHTSKSQPILPAGWKMWEFWQYTSTGKVNGISGAVDKNRYQL